MSAVDWRDMEHDWEVVVEVVDPHDADSVVGTLAGVDVGGCSVTEGYYTDTRASATVTTVTPDGEDGYVRWCRLRIVLRVTRWSWERELFCGFVTDMRPIREGGMVRREYSLDSALWGISADAIESKVTCGQGASALSVARKLLSDRQVQYDDLGAADRSVQRTTVYEPGTMLLNLVYDLLDRTDRISCDGHGRITLRRYVPPSQLTPTVDIDPDDPRTTVVGEVEETDASWDVPGAAIVTATVTRTAGSDTTQETVAGSYRAPASDQSSRARRGYLRYEQRDYDGDADDPTQGQLADAAKAVLDGLRSTGRTFDLTVLYMDLRQGDMAWLAYGGERVRCLVQSVETDLGERTQRLTLREA